MRNASPFRRTIALRCPERAPRGTAMEPLGIAFTEIGPDYLRGTMPVDARTASPNGLLHGGASTLLAETSAAPPAALCVEKAGVVGIEINANHLAGVRQGPGRTGAAPARGPQYPGLEIRIEDDRGRLACISRLTLAVIPLPG